MYKDVFDIDKSMCVCVCFLFLFFSFLFFWGGACTRLYTTWHRPSTHSVRPPGIWYRLFTHVAQLWPSSSTTKANHNITSPSSEACKENLTTHKDVDDGREFESGFWRGEGIRAGMISTRLKTAGLVILLCTVRWMVAQVVGVRDTA